MNRFCTVLYLLAATFTVLSHTATAQLSGRGIELFDAQWQPAEHESDARFLVRKRKLDKQITETCYYRVYGPLIRIETTNADGLPHGTFAWYDQKGHVDSLGNYVNGVKDGDWYYYNDSFKINTRDTYANGVLVATKDYVADRNKPKQKDSTAVAARFDDIPGSWARFLSKNLRYPKVAIDRGIQGNVVLRFVLDEDGKVTEPWIEGSVDISLDDESLRLIRVSPAWVPAEKQGKPTKSYMLQPIGYRLP